MNGTAPQRNRSVFALQRHLRNVFSDLLRMLDRIRDGVKRNLIINKSIYFHIKHFSGTAGDTTEVFL